ncbi:MAG TPA: ECF transporter S component, partial [Clostridiales bacterium]|nr:ECF transporter S component [Clostridiales bacterium]
MSTASSQSRRKILLLVQFSLLLAIEAIVCFTPLGSLPALGPIVATLSHIPVVLTAVLLGTGAGAAMGFMFGLFSFIVWTFTPPSPVIAFVFTPFYSLGEIEGNFWSLVICFVPRILIGVVTGLCLSLLKKLTERYKKLNVPVYAVSGFLGSLANTIFVLAGIAALFVALVTVS